MFNILETCFASIIKEILPHFSFQLMRLVASGNVIIFGTRTIVKSYITLNDFQTGCIKSLFLGNLKFLRRVMLLHIYGWVIPYSPSPEVYWEAAWRALIILITNGAALLLKFYSERRTNITLGRNASESVKLKLRTDCIGFSLITSLESIQKLSVESQI